MSDFDVLDQPSTGAPGREEPHHDSAEPGQGAPPVGQGEYVVQSGDCMSSIAKSHGYFWETIWNHPANAELNSVRKNPNVLLPGDRVTLPTSEPKKEAGQTEMRHRFRRRGEPAKLRLRLLDASDQPRSAMSYTLEIDGQLFSGITDVNGRLEYPVHGNAKTAVLRLSDEGEEEEYILHLGDVNPIDAVTGVQQRLNNLGFSCGAVDGILGPRTEAAIMVFQEHHRLEPSGLIDEFTRNKLIEVHGC